MKEHPDNFYRNIVSHQACLSRNIQLQVELLNLTQLSELDSAAMNLVVSRGMFLMEANSLIFFNLTRTLP